MTVTEFAKRDGVAGSTARSVVKKMGIGTWVEGRRELTETEWQTVKLNIRDKAGRPPKEPTE